MTTGSYERGEIQFLHTVDYRAVLERAIEVIGVLEEGTRAFMIDATASLDPYWIVRRSKRMDPVNYEQMLDRIFIVRTFTAYQFDEIVKRLDEELDEENFSFLGIIDLSGRFLEEEMDDEEGRWLRSRCLKKIKRVTEERELYCFIGDLEMGPSVAQDKKEKKQEALI